MNRGVKNIPFASTLVCVILIASIYVRFLFQGDNAYGSWVSFLTENPAGILIFSGLALSIAWGGVRAARSALKAPECSAEYIGSLDISAAFPVSEGDWSGPLSAWLKEKGFDLKEHSASGYALKGRWSFLPGAVLRVGLLLFLAGFWLSHHERQVFEVLLRPGSPAVLGDLVLTLGRIDAGLPEGHLQVGREKGFRIKDAKVQLEGPEGPLTVPQGWPVKFGGRYFSLAGLGYTQSFNRFVRDGAYETDTLDLDILPPGKEDTAILFGEEVRISLAPEKTVKKGRLSGELYNLKAPSYRLKHPGKDILVVSPGSHGGVLTTGPDIAAGLGDFWVRIRVVQDPGISLITWSLPVMGAGLILLFSDFFWYRREVVCLHQNQELILGYGEQYLKKWGI